MCRNVPLTDGLRAESIYIDDREGEQPVGLGYVYVGIYMYIEARHARMDRTIYTGCSASFRSTRRGVFAAGNMIHGVVFLLGWFLEVEE